MSASMLDEIAVPKEPKVWTCPCCVLGFNDVQAFIDHLERMKARIDGALRTVK